MKLLELGTKKRQTRIRADAPFHFGVFVTVQSWCALGLAAIQCSFCLSRIFLSTVDEPKKRASVLNVQQ